MRLSKLPGWVVPEAESIEDEARDLATTTEAERWELAVRCARDAMWAASASGMRDEVLAYVDPLPPSTVEALARLRSEAGWGRGVR